MIAVTAAELPAYIEGTWADGRVPIVHGQPGIGKTAIAEQVAAGRNMPVWALRLAQRDPMALTGFAMPDLASGTMRFLPAEDWPAVASVVFLDEINRAPVLTQNAAFEFIEKARAGGKLLAAGSVIMAAVNYTSDGGGIQRMPSALGNRFRHFYLEVDVAAWCGWAIGAGVHPLVIAYHRWVQGTGGNTGRAGALHEFDREQDAWPSPRTWESVSRTVQRGATGRELLVCTAGDVGEARAIEFCAFFELNRSLPSIDAILMNPDTAPLPGEISSVYAVSAALAARASDQNFGRVVTYLERLPAEFLAFAVKDATRRPHLEADCLCSGCLRVDGIVHAGDYTAAMVRHAAVLGV